MTDQLRASITPPMIEFRGEKYTIADWRAFVAATEEVIRESWTQQYPAEEKPSEFELVGVDEEAVEQRVAAAQAKNKNFAEAAHQQDTTAPPFTPPKSVPGADAVDTTDQHPAEPGADALKPYTGKPEYTVHQQMLAELRGYTRRWIGYTESSTTEQGIRQFVLQRAGKIQKLIELQNERAHALKADIEKLEKQLLSQLGSTDPEHQRIAEEIAELKSKRDVVLVDRLLNGIRPQQPSVARVTPQEPVSAPTVQENNRKAYEDELKLIPLTHAEKENIKAEQDRIIRARAAHWTVNHKHGEIPSWCLQCAEFNRLLGTIADTLIKGARRP